MRKMTPSQIASIIAVVLLACWGEVAEAQLSRPRTFVGNQTQICMGAGAYDANLALLFPGGVSSLRSTLSSTFRPDGTLTQSGKSLGISHGATGVGSTPATESEYTCSGTYVVNGDGTISTTMTCNSTTLTGPGTGQNSTFAPLVSLLLPLQNGQILINQETTPNVETVTNLTTGVVSQRICHRTNIRFRQ